VLLNARLGPAFRTFLHRVDSLVCADGAVNRLFDEGPHWMGGAEALRVAIDTMRTPLAVVGDMDSASASNLATVTRRGGAVLRLQEQDTTDFDKALDYLERQEIDARKRKLLIYGGRPTRLDHMLSTLNSMLRYERSFGRIVKLDEYATVEIIPEGSHVVRLAAAHGPLPVSCALLPAVGSVSSVTTVGLRYELRHQPLAFGVCISSSNHAESREIEVSTSDPLVLWTALPRPKTTVTGKAEN